MIQIRTNMNNDSIQKGALVDMICTANEQNGGFFFEGGGAAKKKTSFLFSMFFWLWKAHLK